MVWVVIFLNETADVHWRKFKKASIPLLEELAFFAKLSIAPVVPGLT
jgi:hypothetical protein